MNDELRENLDMLPKQKRLWDAWLDVRSMEDFVLKPWTRKQFKLWIGIGLPAWHFARVEWRSWNAVKFGIDTIGNIIDENYTWEISATLVNTWDEDFVVEKFDRIAQIVVMPYLTLKSSIVEDLWETNRGSQWFGSSWVK